MWGKAALKPFVSWLRAYRREVAIDGALVPILGVLGAGAMALAGLADSHGRVPIVPGGQDRVVVLAAGFALTLVAAMTAAFRNLSKAPASAHLRDLEKRVNDADGALDALSALELADLFDHLDYSTSERISLYIPSADGSHLRLVARHALTAEYRAKGRNRYPLEQGCLGLAWKTNEASVVDLPDPQADAPAWRKRLLDDWQIPEQVSEGFKMKTRTCIAFGILPRFGSSRGVIVFESQFLPGARATKAVLTAHELKGQMRNKYRERLLRLLEIHARLER